MERHVLINRDCSVDVVLRDHLIEEQKSWGGRKLPGGGEDYKRKSNNQAFHKGKLLDAVVIASLFA